MKKFWIYKTIKSLPDPTLIKSIEEPWIKATIITPDQYLGSIIKLCQNKRGIQTNLSLFR